MLGEKQRQTFDGLPGRTLHMWLFRNVKNCGDLHKQVQSQNFNPECAFLDASLVVDAWLVQLAAFKALAAQNRESLRTRSLHGELVHNLSGTKHIGESFKRYGISSSTRDLLICRFDLQPGEEDTILQKIDGTQESLSTLPSLADLQTLHKFHKWTPAEEKSGDLIGGIATRMASRDC